MDVREMYEKPPGQLNPGAKGLSMSTEQWAALVAGMPRVSQAAGGEGEAQ